MEINEDMTDDTQSLTSLDKIDKQRGMLTKYLTLLNNRHNLCVPINKVISRDLLLKILALAIFGSALPGTTTMNISHVCHYWRRLAMECPDFWGFADFSCRKISALFLKRSKNAPITLSWSIRHPLFEHHPKYLDFEGPNKPYFLSYFNLFPRLDTFVLHIPFSLFRNIRHLLRNSGPLRLRSLDIRINDDFTNPDTMWYDFFSLDTAYLRELKLRELSLPWITPPHQKLTSLSVIRPRILPTPDQLFTFLSHCPALNELEISLLDNDPTTSRQPEQHVPNDKTRSKTLDFIHLTKLKLGAGGVPSYECVREISSRIRTQRPLSSFWMEYSYLPSTLAAFSSTNVLALAPAGILSQIRNEHFLSITLRSGSGDFSINASHVIPQWDKPSTVISDSFSLSLTGREPSGRPFNHSPIVDLIHKMTELRHLQLVSSACRELLKSWDINLPVIFPHLITLELSDRGQPHRDCTDSLTALTRFPDLKLQTLILRNIRVNASVLSDVISKIEIKTLKLSDYYVDHEVFALLRERGVEVIAIDEDILTVAGI